MWQDDCNPGLHSKGFQDQQGYQTEPCLNMKQNKRKQKVQTWYDHIGMSEVCHMN